MSEAGPSGSAADGPLAEAVANLADLDLDDLPQGGEPQAAAPDDDSLVSSDDLVLSFATREGTSSVPAAPLFAPDAPLFLQTDPNRGGPLHKPEGAY